MILERYIYKHKMGMFPMSRLITIFIKLKFIPVAQVRIKFFFSLSLFGEVHSLPRDFTVNTGMVLNGLDGENAGLGIASSVF